MYWIIDNLVAVTIAGILIFVLVAIQSRSQDASIETAQFDAGRTAMHEFTSVVSQDFINIGAGRMHPEEAALEIDSTSDTRTFSFLSRTDPNELHPQRVTYRWQEIEDSEITLSSGEEVTRLGIERQVGELGSWETVSSGNITDFNITLRNRELESIHSPSPGVLGTTRRIDVRVRMISPLGKGDLIEEVRWDKNIRPPNLQRNRGALLVQ